MKKKIYCFIIIFLIILISCAVSAKYILTKDFDINVSSKPLIFETVFEKDTFVMDTVGVDINFSVKNFNENQNYNDFDVEYQITLEDTSKFDFQVTRSVSTKTLIGGSKTENLINLRLLPYDMSTLNKKENITLKITSLTPYKKEIQIPITINTNPYTLSGIELNYLIKNGSYAPEGDVYDYYAVDGNRLKDETVKKIVFGKRSEYTSAVSGIEAEPIDVNGLGLVNLYRKPNTDGKTYTIYILSEDGTFELSENAAWTFDKLYALESIENLHLVDTSEVTNMRDMFCDCAALKKVDLSNFKTSKVTDMIGMFARMYEINYLDLTTFDTSSIDKISMFLSENTSKRIYVSNKFSVKNATDTVNMFSACKNIIGQNGTKYDSTKLSGTMAVIDGSTQGYFCGMYGFSTGADTNNIMKAKTQAERDEWAVGNRYMDLTIKEITLGQSRNYNSIINNYTPVGIDTFESGVISCYRVPNGDGTYHIYLLSDTGNLIANSNMSFMFDGMKNLLKINNLNLLDTNNTTQMKDVFCDAQRVTSLDLSNFKTSKVTTMDGMFARMYSIKTIDVSTFDTSSVTTMLNMFYQAVDTYTIDEYRTANPTLTTIYASDLWTTSAIKTPTENMFINNLSLVGGAGTRYNENNKTPTYARIDSSGTPGYFTRK